MHNRDKVNITFFTPTLQKTGSEIVLFNLLNYLPDYFKATVVSKYKGALYDLLPKEINRYFIFANNKPSNLFSKIYYRLFKNVILSNKLKKFKHSIWYINTIVMPEILNYAVCNNIKVIMHVHELQHMYGILNETQLKQLLTYPELIIANSNATKHVLEKFKATSPLQICYPAINTNDIKFDFDLYKAYRNQLQIDEHTFVWTMVGSLDENKNPILFIDIASLLANKHENFKMIWIGTSSQGINGEQKYKDYALEKGANDKIIWITKETNDYLNFFNCADGFVLTSKLESFSLVTLEALLFGLPVVANNCIGVNEILGHDYGNIIDNSNPEKMSEAMLNYMQFSKPREFEKTRNIATKFDISTWKTVWIDLLNQYIVDK